MPSPLRCHSTTWLGCDGAQDFGGCGGRQGRSCGREAAGWRFGAARTRGREGGPRVPHPRARGPASRRCRGHWHQRQDDDDQDARRHPARTRAHGVHQPHGQQLHPRCHLLHAGADPAVGKAQGRHGGPRARRGPRAEVCRRRQADPLATAQRRPRPARSFRRDRPHRQAAGRARGADNDRCGAQHRRLLRLADRGPGSRRSVSHLFRRRPIDRGSAPRAAGGRCPVRGQLHASPAHRGGRPAQAT